MATGRLHLAFELRDRVTSPAVGEIAGSLRRSIPQTDHNQPPPYTKEEAKHIKRATTRSCVCSRIETARTADRYDERCFLSVACRSSASESSLLAYCLIVNSLSRVWQPF